MLSGHMLCTPKLSNVFQFQLVEHFPKNIPGHGTSLKKKLKRALGMIVLVKSNVFLVGCFRHFCLKLLFKPTYKTTLLAAFTRW